MPTHENLFHFTEEDAKRLRENIQLFRESMDKAKENLLLNKKSFPILHIGCNAGSIFKIKEINKPINNIDYSGIEQRIISSLPNIKDFAKAINIFKNLAPSAQELSDSLNKLKLAKVKLTDTEEKKKPYYQQQASIWANSWDTKLKKKLKK